MNLTIKKANPSQIWARPEDNYSNDYGTFDAYGITFDNQDQGVFHVVQGNTPRFKVNEPAFYTIKDKGKHPSDIKFKSEMDAQKAAETQAPQAFAPPQSNGVAPAPQPNQPDTLTFRDRLIARQTCIKAAAEFCAQRSNDRFSWEDEANAMFDWVIKPESVEAKEIVNHVLPTGQDQPAEDDNLFPF